MDKQVIIKQLGAFGLPEEVALVYVCLLQLGEASVLDVARFTKLKRPSIYNYINVLVERGLAHWEDRMKGKVAVPDSPEKFMQDIEERRSVYTSMLSTYEQMLPALHAMRIRKDFSPQVRYYEGVSGVKEIESHALEAKGFIYSYTGYNWVQGVGMDFGSDYYHIMKERGLVEHVIVNRKNLSEKEKHIPSGLTREEYFSLHLCRVVGDDFYINHDINIFDDTYAIINLNSDNLMGLEIIDAELAKTQKSIFEMVWNGATPVNLDEYYVT